MADTALGRAVTARGIKPDEQIQAEQAIAEKRRQSWQDALRAAALGAATKGADAQTMAGFAVGRWLSDYLARGRDKAEQRANEALDAQDAAKWAEHQKGKAIGDEVWGEGTTYALQPGLLGGSADPSNFAKLASAENMLNSVGLGSEKYTDPITQATNDIVANNFTGPNAGRFFDKNKGITNIFGF